jgi:flagellar biosynthesis/type III secretory pathway protein FliH
MNSHTQPQEATLENFFGKGKNMKTQKGLLVLATISMLGLNVACNDRYEEGFTAGKSAGYAEGYDAGYDDGDADGFARAELYFASADYNKGKADGIAIGIAQGYTNGYNVGRNDGLSQGYNNGYGAGYDDGYDDGYLDGEDAGYAIGYDDGYDDGSLDGYDIGYDDGFLDGYDVGYDDGFDDGFGLSVGKTKALKGYANLVSMVHNDLIDYSKIKAPKQTAKGLVANGKLILAETSLTNKDTLKRAAAVEQYLVVEMSKQVAKLGLSATRSLQVAKAANHFRKFSSKAALTAADTNAYASEIIGVDIKTLEKAVESTVKGDVSAYNAVMEKAAAKNGTSAENMSKIVSQLFL